jgi:TolA-binding protein
MSEEIEKPGEGPEPDESTQPEKSDSVDGRAFRRVQREFRELRQKYEALETERKQKQESELSEVEKLRKQISELEGKASTAERYRGVLESERDHLISQLSEEDRKDFEEDDDPDVTRQLKYLRKLVARSKTTEPPRAAPGARGAPASPDKLPTFEDMTRDPSLYTSLSKEQREEVRKRHVSAPSGFGALVNGPSRKQ